MIISIKQFEYGQLVPYGDPKEAALIFIVITRFIKDVQLYKHSRYCFKSPFSRPYKWIDHWWWENVSIKLDWNPVKMTNRELTNQ